MSNNSDPVISLKTMSSLIPLVNPQALRQPTLGALTRIHKLSQTKVDPWKSKPFGLKQRFISFCFFGR